jgi:cytosine/adenosine deaminase-related metal-dependent hydrolase
VGSGFSRILFSRTFGIHALMWTWTRPVSLVNARVALPDGIAASIRFGSRILSIGDAPCRGDTVVDLNGAFVLPGLVNAHDHLELNHYGPLKRRDRYENAADWIDDLRPALQEDQAIRMNSSHALAARLFIGALKNLLAGVTTVAHHNPLYREIGRGFPVRVLRRYGWAHSFRLERQPVGARGEIGGAVRERCLATPAGIPFMVHVAEGIDRAAAEELPRLESLGCLRSNTVLVHGVAITVRQWERVLAGGSNVVWCPASNQFLFGRTAPVRAFLDACSTAWRHVCLGSDSRVTGSRDLLDEMRTAASIAAISPRELLRMVTEAPARILNLPEAGSLAVGVPADLIVVPSRKDTPADAVLAARRRDLALVTIGGRPVVGCPTLSAVFVARRITAHPVAIDGVERLVACALARAIARSPIAEPGVECLS